MRKKVSKTGFMLAGGLVMLINLAWHQSPQLVDALTQQPAQGFYLEVSFWRIILEPFTGPLVFYVRSNSPIAETAWLLAWIVLAFFIIRAATKKSFIKGLQQLPSVLAIAIALLLLALFFPLPSESIRTNLADRLFLNIHSHSYYSHDGMISPDRLMKWHKNNGFDAFFLTEHNHHTNTLNLAQQQPDNARPFLLVGQEYSGSNHILLLGLSQPFTSKDMPDSVAVRAAHEQGGAAILAHWFSPHKNTLPLADYVQDGIDGMEIINQAEGITYDPGLIGQIRAAAAKEKLLLAGAADYHGYGSACLTWNVLHIPGWHNMNHAELRDSIIRLMRRREQNNWQVLCYHDRPIYAKTQSWLVPISNIWYYFASLSAKQLASWIIWLGIFAFIPLNFNSAVLLANTVISFFSFYFILTGFSLRQFNTQMSGVGLWLLLVSVFFWFFFLLKKR